MKHSSIFFIYKRLLKNISSKRKIQIMFLFLISIFSAAAEILTLGSLMPFIDLLIDAKKIYNYEMISKFFNNYGIENERDIAFSITIIFITLVIIANSLRIFLIWFNTVIIYGMSQELTEKSYSNIISQPYLYYVNTNTSSILGNIEKILGVSLCMQLLLQGVSAFIISLSIIGMIVYLESSLAFIAGVVAFLYYLIIGVVLKKKLFQNSKKLSENINKRIQIVQESLGGIREIIIRNVEKIFLFKFNHSNKTMYQAMIRNHLISSMPGPSIILLLMIVLTCIIYLFSVSENGLVYYLPILGVLILASQKLVPLLQQIYAAWSKTQGLYMQTKDVLEVLEKLKKKVRKKSKKLKFKKFVGLNNVSFKYNEKDNYILKNVSLKINKNNIIGIIGKSGQGKSTLVDLITGLIKPTHGDIKVDNKRIKNNELSWQKNIAYVPQKVHVMDTSISENIAFGVDKENIDFNLVEKCSNVAELTKFINSKKDKFETQIGERGTRLSGGQMQRIGIARALYYDANILIFDESTNAIDEETEKKIYDNLKKFNKKYTVIVITHRKSLIRHFDSTYLVENKKVKKLRK